MGCMSLPTQLMYNIHNLYKEEQIVYPIQITRTYYIKNTLQGSITHYINKVACSIQITKSHYIKNTLHKQGSIT